MLYGAGIAAVCELLHSALIGRSKGTRGASPAARTSQVFSLSWLATADEVIDLLRLLTAAHGTKRKWPMAPSDVLPQCYLALRSTGEIAGETAHVHHAARRRGRMAARGEAAAGWLPPRRRALDATVGRTVTLAKCAE